MDRGRAVLGSGRQRRPVRCSDVGDLRQPQSHRYPAQAGSHRQALRPGAAIESATTDLQHRIPRRPGRFRRGLDLEVGANFLVFESRRAGQPPMGRSDHLPAAPRGRRLRLSYKKVVLVDNGQADSDTGLSHLRP